MLEKDHYARFESCTVVLIVYASCLKLENDSSLTFSSWCKSTHMFRLPVRAVSHVALWEVIVSLRVIWCQLCFRHWHSCWFFQSWTFCWVGHKPLFVKRGIFYPKNVHFQLFWYAILMRRAVDTAEGIWEVGLYWNYLKFGFLRSLKRYSQRLYAYFREGWRHLFYECFKTWTSYYFKYGRPTKVIYVQPLIYFWERNVVRESI